MDFKEFCERLFVKFNKQQAAAIQTVKGPILLLAVPGSGKTTVLVARLGYMVYCCKILPESILTLTYTKAATKVMRERFNSFFGNKLSSRMEFRTINSLCTSIIKFYGERIGKKSFELLDDKDILKTLRDIYIDIEKEYPNENVLKDIKTKITYIKNMMLSSEEIRELENESDMKLCEIYNRYCEEMKDKRFMDYDDQMIYAYNLLKNPFVLSHFQNKYEYICVDEAQDTSKIQHKIIALLSSKTDNLFMVGDEDQSIYGFRAAFPDALLSFEKDHKNSKVLFMEENFRSNANIVIHANDFIRLNTMRRKKNMKATREYGSDIVKIFLKYRSDQYMYLVNAAKKLSEQTAVLYRNNESVIPLVDLFERTGVPYKIRNAELSFFTNRVVLDIQNILSFAIDNKNVDLFMQIYYKLPLYLSKNSAMELCEISQKLGTSVFEVMTQTKSLGPSAIKKLVSLYKDLEKIKKEMPANAITYILDEMGYSDYLEKKHISDSCVFILKNIAIREKTISGFLSRLAQLKDIIENKANDNNSLLILSTIHSSKGLEYDNVYLLDVIDDIFPDEIPDVYELMDDENKKKKYEEERRIFYVGVTRAKENLYIFDINNSSTFLRQLTYFKSKKRTRLKNKTKENITKKSYDSYGAGEIVYHKKFGQGVIVDKSNGLIFIKFGNKMRTFDFDCLMKNNLLE